MLAKKSSNNEPIRHYKSIQNHLMSIVKRGLLDSDFDDFANDLYLLIERKISHLDSFLSLLIEEIMVNNLFDSFNQIIIPSKLWNLVTKEVFNHFESINLIKRLFSIFNDYRNQSVPQFHNFITEIVENQSEIHLGEIGLILTLWPDSFNHFLTVVRKTKDLKVEEVVKKALYVINNCDTSGEYGDSSSYFAHFNPYLQKQIGNFSPEIDNEIAKTLNWITGLEFPANIWKITPTKEGFYLLEDQDISTYDKLEIMFRGIRCQVCFKDIKTPTICDGCKKLVSCGFLKILIERGIKISECWFPPIEIRGVTREKDELEEYSKKVAYTSKVISLNNLQLTEIDLSSIQLCTQLQTLNLSNNQLTEIDLAPLRHCTQLQTLNLLNNQLTEIDLAPLRHCTQLQTLNLSNNQLTEIDLSPLRHCKQLHRLELPKNQLTHIDLSPLRQCTQLWLLRIEQNQLTHIDLSPLNQSTRLCNLNLSNNKLTEIDLAPLRHCTQLQTLNLLNNQLTEIDLAPLHHCTRFQTLNLSNNQLTEIDLSPLQHCKQLLGISLGNNQLAHLELPSLSQCTRFCDLELYKNQLTEIDLTPLKPCKQLHTIDLDGNQLTHIDLSPLYQSTRLYTLKLLNNQLIKIDLSPLQLCKKLKFFYIDDKVQLMASESLQSAPWPKGIQLRIDKKTANLSYYPQIWRPPKIDPKSPREIEIKGRAYSSEDDKYKEYSMKITTDTKEICIHQQLERIDLSPLLQCTKLERLDLQNNQLTEVDLTPLLQCPDLHTLNLRNNRLSSVNLTPLTYCHKLKNLILGSNRLSHLDLKPVINCSAIKLLDLSSNQLTHVSDEIIQLRSLQYLYLNQNSLKSVPSFNGLHNLIQLNLSDNHFSELSETFFEKLALLQDLNISNCPLTQIPDSITALKNLKTLNLGNTELTSLPDHVYELSNLKKVNIQGFKHKIPENLLERLPELTIKIGLYWADKGLKDIGEIQFLLDFNRLQNGQNSLRRYKLQRVEGTIEDGHIVGLGFPTSTYKPNLFHLPGSIVNLRFLRRLNLRGNHITQLPDSIGKLENLENLDLRGNHIPQLPDSIGKLENLENLHLRGNQITQLPDSIGKLENLKIIDLTSNPLTSLPDSFIQLKKLKSLFLRRVPINKPLTQLSSLKNLETLQIDIDKLLFLPDSVFKMNNLRIATGAGSFDGVDHTFSKKSICALELKSVVDIMKIIKKKTVLPKVNHFKKELKRLKERYNRIFDSNPIDRFIFLFCNKSENDLLRRTIIEAAQNEGFELAEIEKRIDLLLMRGRLKVPKPDWIRHSGSL